MLFRKIQETISALDFNTITEDRKILLRNLIDYTREKVNRGSIIQLNFICTHNSRRSQLGQVWAQVMGNYYQIPLQSFSGGTEVTACHENTIKTLQKSGFKITSMRASDNPKYICQFSNDKPHIQLFSKLFDNDANPKSEFAAIMTCGHAEENCPFVPGCEKRIALTYEDPKKYDNTDLQEEKYLERSLQIATELKYVFDKIQKQ